ncbi:MAG: DUF4834 family protein [Bacteroidia bacterium]|nr:DUF4834 family protein [Bacteroidia bacterium]
MLLIKIIFWMIVIYYALKLIVRFLLPFLLKRLTKRMFSNFEQMQNQAQQQTRYQKQKDEITIEYTQQKKSSIDKDKGEYVDFEEVKD